MKNLILAALMAAVPATSFAQKDKSKEARERRENRAADALDRGVEAGAVDLAEAAKLQDSISAAIAQVEAAAHAFLAAAKAADSSTDAAKDPAARAVEQARVKLEIAGVRLEDLYGKAVRLHIKDDSAKAEGNGEAATDAAKEAALAVPEDLEAAAGARVRLANAQIAGGRAAARLVAHKIARARAHKDSAVPAELAEGMRAAAVEVSKAKAALSKGGHAAAQGVQGGGKAAGGKAAGGKAAEGGAQGGGKKDGKPAGGDTGGKSGG